MWHIQPTTLNWMLTVRRTMADGFWQLARLGLTLSQAASSIFRFLIFPNSHCCLLERQILLDSFRFYNHLVVLLFIPGKLTRRGSSDAATEMESLSAKHAHSHHTLVSELPEPSNSHGENAVKEGGQQFQFTFSFLFCCSYTKLQFHCRPFLCVLIACTLHYVIWLFTCWLFLVCS